MIAKSQGDGVVAMCINSKSDQSGKYKYGSDSYSKYRSGHYGAIGSPGESEEIIKLYAEEL